MDKIEIKLALEAEANYSYDENGKIQNYIPVIKEDGSQHFIVTASCFINDELINKTFSIYEFLRSSKSGSPFIFTCSCGVAGCAGIWDGINVKQRRYTVEWRIPNRSNYNGLSKKFYSFNTNQYNQEIDFVYNQLVDYSKSPLIHDTDSYECEDFNLLDKNIKYYKRAYEGKDYYDYA